MIEVAIIKHKRGQSNKKTHTLKEFPEFPEARKFVTEFNKREHDVWVYYATIIVNW